MFYENIENQTHCDYNIDKKAGFLPILIRTKSIVLDDVQLVHKVCDRFLVNVIEVDAYTAESSIQTPRWTLVLSVRLECKSVSKSSNYLTLHVYTLQNFMSYDTFQFFNSTQVVKQIKCPC